MNAFSPSQPSSNTRVNWRGVGFYLFLCFSASWAIELIALARGVRFAQLSAGEVALLATVMLIPAASAFTVRRWIVREGFGSAGLRFGTWKTFLYIWLGVPCLFLAIYVLTCVFHLGKFATDCTSVYKTLPPIPAGAALPSATRLLMLVLIGSLTVGPLLTTVFTFGEEFGWTGYLLPSLLPLGRWKATLIYGAIWGLWHAPLVAGGFNYPGHPIAGIFFMCAFTTAVGSIQCALLLRYRSVLLTSFLHALFNSQTRGVWPFLVTGVVPLLGGPLGLLGILTIGIAGIWLLARTSKERMQEWS